MSDGAAFAEDAETDGKTVSWSDAIWQRGFTMVPNAILLDVELSAAAFRTFVVLIHLAWMPEDEWPGQDGLALIARCSERTLRSALDELRDAGLVRTRRRGRGLTNVYDLTFPRAANSADQESRAAKVADLERSDPAALTLLSKEELQDNPWELVSEAWTRHAPPLIRHPAGVLAAAKTRRAINGAVAVYPAGAVVAAVENYAAVLGDDEYVWSHRWTLVDFLRRGLDRFVPDSDPLANCQRRSSAGTGRRDPRIDGLDQL